MIHLDKHFSTIAEDYRQLRSTESAPVNFIASRVENIENILALDVGCGCGRYSFALLKKLSPKIKLICIDRNLEMLKQLTVYLKRNNVQHFYPIVADAGNLPLKNNSVDLIVTFNAIHHFPLIHFFREVWRLLRKNGMFFIYTRTRSQNRRHIWGKYFPLFCEKETRLYEEHELKNYLRLIPQIKIVGIKHFRFHKRASISRLIELAHKKHYSTFALYEEGEFRNALKGFIRNLKENFEDLSAISWVNENILFVAQKL